MSLSTAARLPRFMADHHMSCLPAVVGDAAGHMACFNCCLRYKKLWDQDKDAYTRRYEKAQKPLSSYEADVTEYMNKEVGHPSRLTTVHEPGYVQYCDGVEWNMHSKVMLEHLRTSWHNKDRA